MNTQKVVMIPEDRYWKMIETYDEALETIETLKKALAIATNNHKSSQEFGNQGMNLITGVKRMSI